MNKNIEHAARAHAGFITSSEATRFGVQRRDLSQAVKAGELVQLDRGLYATPDTWEDEYVIAQHRFARGVFSHDTALYLLDFSDQAPESLTLSFPRGYNPSAAKRFGLVAKSSPAGLHDLGVTSVTTPYGNAITCYDAERTLCDMMRGTAAPDLQLLNPAMRAYLYSTQRNIPRILSYARSLNVERKVRTYLEVLL